MKKIMLVLLFIHLAQMYAQLEDAWVYLTDKPQAATYLANPLSMLSQRALDRRARYNIALDIQDVPIDDNYLNQIKNATGITVKAHSKWLNAIHVQGTQTDISALLNFSFVNSIEFANKNLGSISRPHPNVNNKTNKFKSLQNTYNYGLGFAQIHLMNGEIVHQNGFTGAGVLIGIIDAGFNTVDTSAFFAPLFTNGKIKDVYNFVSGNANVYQSHYHGTMVLSTIAANDDGNFVGTAPDADFALYVSEDVNQEMPIEESYWAEAAERADSLGVDVINTSLGYTTFDRADYNYTMDDLNGQTSFITRAANIAVSRGIHVVVSAGNSANSSWPKIGFPADSPYVITVGAVDTSGVRASFSSIGPTADGRIKPDVMAVGKNATVYYNNISQNNGTSFSSPILAGMIACWVQAQPNLAPAQLKQQLLEISDRYLNPDNQYGYGIPDFSQANFILGMSDHSSNHFSYYPNPVFQNIYFKNIPVDFSFYTLYNISGQKIQTGKIQPSLNLDNLKKGFYILKIGKQKFKIIKQ